MEGMEEMDRKQPDAIGKNCMEPKVKSIHSIHCLHCSLTWLNQMAYGRDTLTQRFPLSKHPPQSAHSRTGCAQNAVLC